jgi:hypothetical protein
MGLKKEAFKLTLMGVSVKNNKSGEELNNEREYYFNFGGNPIHGIPGIRSEFRRHCQ